MVPSAVRATRTTGNPRCLMKSTHESVSLRGTRTPPAPSTISHFDSGIRGGGSRRAEYEPHSILPPSAAKPVPANNTLPGFRPRRRAPQVVRTVSRSVPSREPVCTGFQYIPSSAAHKQGGDHGFSDTGVGSGHKQSLHSCPMACGRQGELAREPDRCGRQRPPDFLLQLRRHGQSAGAPCRPEPRAGGWHAPRSPPSKGPSA